MLVKEKSDEHKIFKKQKKEQGEGKSGYDMMEHLDADFGKDTTRSKESITKAYRSMMTLYRAQSGNQQINIFMPSLSTTQCSDMHLIEMIGCWYQHTASIRSIPNSRQFYKIHSQH
jgi:hypothetical protein